MKEYVRNMAGPALILPVCIAAALLVLAPRADTPGGGRETELAQAGLSAVGVAHWLAVSLLVPTWTRRWGEGRAILSLGVFGAAGMVAAYAFPAGRLCGIGTALVHVYVFCYGLAACGITSLAGALARRGWVGQAAAAVVAIVLAANVLLVNVVLEKWEPLRNVMITATLATSPMAASGAAVGYDVMRKGTMYEASKISYYNYLYPAWYVTAGVHAALGVFLLGLRRLCGAPAIDEEPV